MKINNVLTALLLVSMIMFIASQAAMGQQLGILKGYISDQSGAAIDWARVVVSNTKERREIKVDKDGKYEMTIPEGEYLISAQANAFHPFSETKVKVMAGEMKELNMALDVNLDNAECLLKATASPKTPAKGKKENRQSERRDKSVKSNVQKLRKN